MILYNVTINIDLSVHDQWLKWMQTKHINDVLATGKFTSARMVKVLVEEQGSVTYSIQYTTESKEKLERYYQEDAPRLRQEGLALFADKMLAFRTELQVMSEHFPKSALQ
jgi:predicted RNA-binding protein with RPS1 domain